VGALSATLWFCLRADSIGWFMNAAHLNASLSTPLADTFAQLSSSDFVYALVCLPLGLIALFASSLLVGLDLLPAPGANTAFDRLARTALGVAHGAAYRRVPIGIALLLSPRLIVWPTMIVLATFGLATYSRLEQAVLQGTSGSSLLALMVASVWLIVATIAVPLASAAQLFSERVLTNSLQLIGWVFQILLPTFWIAAAALLLFNVLFVTQGWAPALNGTCAWVTLPPLVSPACAQPFAVSWVSLASCVFFIGVGITLLVRRVRGQ
jgi:hypothetical protein